MAQDFSLISVCHPSKMVGFFEKYIKSKMTDDQRKMLNETPFAHLLQMSGGIKVSAALLTKLVDVFDPNDRAFSISNKKVRFTVQDVGLALGLPTIGSIINLRPDGKRKRFSNDNHINKTYFLDANNKPKNQTREDLQKILIELAELDDLKTLWGVNWAQLIHEEMMMALVSSRKTSQPNISGCTISVIISFLERCQIRKFRITNVGQPRYYNWDLRMILTKDKVNDIFEKIIPSEIIADELTPDNFEKEYLEKGFKPKFIRRKENWERRGANEDDLDIGTSYAPPQLLVEATALVPNEGKLGGIHGRIASQIGLVGLAGMGQNLALNIAQKGFPISVYNRMAFKTDETVRRAQAEGGLPLTGHATLKDFVLSIKRPRSIVMLVKAGPPVDSLISSLVPFLEPGDAIIDGGYEWYENTERRLQEAAAKGLLYLGMGVSGGGDGARNGFSLMPGGHKEAYTNVQTILSKIAAQVDDGPCVTYVGPGGSGNFVKMVHNGFGYSNMQLISEAYDILKHVGGLTNAELAQVFQDWNRGELESFLIEITAEIFSVPDDLNGTGAGEHHLVDKILDKTGTKGTGKWTVQEAAELTITAPTIAASLDSRYISGKEESVAAELALQQAGLIQPGLPRGFSWVDKSRLVDDVHQALYASKICCYAQGMNLIRSKSDEKGWNLDLSELARIWKGGYTIRARFLDSIKNAYTRNPSLANLIVDEEFAREMVLRQAACRRVVGLAVESGVSAPGMSASLAYFDAYRRSRLPANLVQAQRDYFGAHTYERVDKLGSFHTEWARAAREKKSASVPN